MLLFTYWWCSNAPRFYDTLPPSMEITEVNFAETFFQRLSLNFLKMVVNGTKVFFYFCMKQNVRKVKKSKEEEEIHSLVEKLWIPRALNFEDKKIWSMLLVVYDFVMFLSIVYLDITCLSYEVSRNNINHFFWPRAASYQFFTKQSFPRCRTIYLILSNGSKQYHNILFSQ